MKKTLALAIALAATLPMAAAAHTAWLRPSQTVLAGDSPWITVDAAVSNDLFHFNHVPLRIDNLVITAPDGTTAEARNAATGKYRSVFDVELLQQGTYRFAGVNAGLSGSWQEDGKPKRWRGDAAAFEAEVPKGAPGLTVTQSVSRSETFVTNGSPTTDNLRPGNQGLELVPVPHPNALFAGEEARFRVLADGEPAAGVEFEITRGGTRYRNAQEEILATTDANGEFTVTWPEAGMYWLEANLRDDRATLPQANARRLGYVATLEVLPQ